MPTKNMEIRSNEWLSKEKIEEIKRKIEVEDNSDLDIDQPGRDADGGRGIGMDVAAELDRIIDRRIEQDDLDENAKKIQNNIVEKWKTQLI